MPSLSQISETNQNYATNHSVQIVTLVAVIATKVMSQSKYCAIFVIVLKIATFCKLYTVANILTLEFRKLTVTNVIWFLIV